MQDFSERREHERVHARLSIFVEVLGRPGGAEADNRILRSQTVDVSAGGLKLWVPEQVAPGSSLNLAIPMEDWDANLELSGKAVWSTEAEDADGYWIGLQLADASRDDMEKWFWVVQSLKA